MGALMLQGTGSDVGRSVRVAGPCRAFANQGLGHISQLIVQGRVRGTFLPDVLASWERLRARSDMVVEDAALDAIAAELETHLDVDGLLELAKED